MKLSELIKILQRYLEAHGDLPVYIVADGIEEEATSVEYVPPVDHLWSIYDEGLPKRMVIE